MNPIEHIQQVQCLENGTSNDELQALWKEHQQVQVQFQAVENYRENELAHYYQIFRQTLQAFHLSVQERDDILRCEFQAVQNYELLRKNYYSAVAKHYYAVRHYLKQSGQEQQ